MKNKKIKIVIIIVLILLLVSVIYFVYTNNNNVNMAMSENGSEIKNDETSLEVNIKSTDINVLEKNTSITVVSNKNIRIEDSKKLELKFASERNDEKYYVLVIKNISIGPNTINLKVIAENGESKDFILSINREDYSLPYGLEEIEDWENTKFTVDGDNLLAQVDKTHKLVEDYAPSDLVDLNKDKLLYTNTTGILLREDAADYLVLMLKDLKKSTNKNIVIASGYRSTENQYKQYISWVKQLGQAEADKVSARPGYSEHSLGTSVDFMSEDSGFNFTNEFDKTDAGKWLTENAFKYGFVKSYPQGKTDKTGYSYEAWHYRYIGVENATKLRSENITLKEWLEKINN